MKYFQLHSYICERKLFLSSFQLTDPYGILFLISQKETFSKLITLMLIGICIFRYLFYRSKIFSLVKWLKGAMEEASERAAEGPQSFPLSLDLNVFTSAFSKVLIIRELCLDWNFKRWAIVHLFQFIRQSFCQCQRLGSNFNPSGEFRGSQVWSNAWGKSALPLVPCR